MTVGVSVVIPARDAAGTLADVLAALVPQVRAHDRAETIVVDNGSTDQTRAIAERYGARVIEHDRPGAAAARNAGWRASTGVLVAFLDSDCIPRPGWLDQLTAALRDAPQLGAAGGRIEPAPSENLLQRYAGRTNYYFNQEQALSDPFLPYLLIGCSCYRRSVLEQLGGLDESLRSGEDTDLTWRMQLKLGLQPGFAPAAIVEHVHRSTLQGIWKQWSRYGYGAVQLEQRYPDRPRPSGQPTRLAARVGAELARSLRNVIALPSRRTDVIDVISPLLRCFEVLANRVGRESGRRELDECTSSPR